MQLQRRKVCVENNEYEREQQCLAKQIKHVVVLRNDLRGAWSSYHRPMKPDFDTPLDVALSDGHIPTHWTAPYGPFLSFIFITLLFLDYSGLVPCKYFLYIYI